MKFYIILITIIFSFFICCSTAINNQEPITATSIEDAGPKKALLSNATNDSGKRKLEFLTRESGEKLIWYSLGSEALEKAKDDNKYIVLYFYIENCVYCDNQDLAFRDKTAIKLLNERFIAVKLDANENMYLFNVFNLKSSFPTTIILAPDGTALGAIQNSLDATGLVHLLNVIISTSEESEAEEATTASMRDE